MYHERRWRATVSLSSANPVLSRRTVGDLLAMWQEATAADRQPTTIRDARSRCSLEDDDGVAIIHAMPARQKFLKGWWTP